jgi:HPt (histidine-containing phosphotransfer) domain-containing protein
VAMFVAKLPDRVNLLSKLMQERNLDELKRTVHQLKGAGGGYGFPKITEAAATAEHKAKEVMALNPGAAEQELAGVSAAINELFEVIRKVNGYQANKEKLAGAQS